MFWLRYKKIIFLVRTLNLRPDSLSQFFDVRFTSHKHKFYAHGVEDWDLMDLERTKPVLGVSVKRDSKQSSQLQRLARRLEFPLQQV